MDTDVPKDILERVYKSLSQNLYRNLGYKPRPLCTCQMFRRVHDQEDFRVY